MKINYKFPEKWCIQVTEENQQVLSNWRFTDGQKVSLGLYVGISKYGGGRDIHTQKKQLGLIIVKSHLKTLKSMY